jgi:hypothetical protein
VDDVGRVYPDLRGNARACNGCAMIKVLSPQPGASGASASMDVRDFVRQVFIHGIPYEEARRYDASAVPVLLAMLRDPAQEDFWANVAVVLGMIGDERAVEAGVSKDTPGRRLAGRRYRRLSSSSPEAVSRFRS